MEHLDGNAAAGELGEVFTLDATTAIATCAGCGATGHVASVHVYEAGMGTVLRCPECDAVLLRLVHARDEMLHGDARRQGAALAKRRRMTRSAFSLRICVRRLRVAGAQRGGERRRGRPRTRSPPSVGLMKPSRSEPIATCSGPIASMWRPSTSSDSRERLRVRAPQRRP